jgi:uncharacterized repeat protein (TIGR01451 family)
MMKTLQGRSPRRFGASPKRSIATFAAYALVLTTVTFGAFPVTPAQAAPGDGVCYLIADSGGGNGGNDLLTLVDRGDFNPATNETNIGTGTGTYSIEAMDMHPATLQLYGANANRLGTLDKLTGVFAPLANTFTTSATPATGALGNIEITDVDGLAFNYSTNVLYGSERQSGNDLLVQIDIVTGEIVRDPFGAGIDYISTNVSAVTGGSDDLDDLAFHPITGVLYGSVTGGNGGHLVTIDPLTGAASYIGAYGAGDIEGMRFDAEGFLWGTSGTSPIALYEINITTGAAVNPRPLDNGGDYESTVCYVPGSDLFIGKAVDITDPLEGTNVTYTVDVFNAGPADATGVVVEDVLPAGVTYVSSAPSQGAYNDASGAWTVGALDRNDAATLDITVSADAGTAGTTITNTATRLAVDQGDAVPNNDSASVEIFPRAEADLAVSKTVSNASPGEGDTIAYTITVVNSGPSAATEVTIDDTLPGGLTFVSSSPSQGTYSSGAGVWTLGTVASGATATLGITATVNGGTSLSTITNTASVGNTDVTDPDPTNDFGSVDLTVSLAGLEIIKSSDATGPVEPGQTITYTLDITNTGTSLLDGVTVADIIPGGTTFVAGSAYVTGFFGGTYLDRFGSQSYNNTDGSPDWTTSWSEIGEGTNPNGGDIRILTDTGTNPDQSPFQLRIKDDDRGIWRSADLDGATYATINFDFRKHSFDSGADSVVIAVAASPTGTYRNLLTISGQGTDSAYSNTGALPLLLGELTDTTTFRFLTSGSLGDNDILWVDNFQVDFAVPAEAVGHDATDLVIPSDDYILPPGGSMQVTFEVVADTVLAQASIDNFATADANGAIPATDAVSDRVAQADVAIDKTVDNANPNPGDLIDFTITVTNNGPSAASLIEVTDVLPSGVTYDSDNGGGAYDPATGLWTVGNLPPTQSASLVVTASVENGTAGTSVTNVATITQTDRPDPDPTNDTDSATVNVPVVDLEVGKSVDNATSNVGDTVVFTVTVTNNGPDVANGASLDDVLPSGVTYVSDSTSQGAYASGVWTVGTLNAAATATLTLTATVDAGTFGTTITNLASVAAVDEVDSDPTNDTDSAAVNVQHNPAIQVSKIGPASATLGETVTYTFTVTHAPTSDLSPVTIDSVIDDIAGSATYVSGDGNGNSLLDGGESWVYTATHTITAADTDPLVNTVTITSTDGDGDPVPDATDSHSTDVEHLPVIVVDKTGPAAALVGSTVMFNFAVSHDAASDGSPVSNVTVTDDIAGTATYVSGDDGDSILEAGETWVFTASYTTTAADPDPLVNTGTATGTDLDGDPVSDTDTHSTDLVPTASVGDYVWHDLNADGVFDAGEPGLDGVAVYVRNGAGIIIDTAVTTAGGSYNFTDLAPGDYTVDVDESTLPLGAPILSTGNEPFSVTLAEGEARTDADFGYFELASIGDFVWDDLDGDGIQDAGEPGIGGVTVHVYDGSDLTTPIATTTTFSDGSYAVPVVPGEYVVEFVMPAGYDFSPANAGGDDSVDSDADVASGQTATITVASGESDGTVDAGTYMPVTIGDYVWEDLDSDGVQDPAEIGLGGITVRIFDGVGTEVGSAVTAGDGSYSVDLPPGSYDVVIDTGTLPAGFVLTTPGTVSTGVLESGDVFDTADFGAVLPTFPVSGTVWNDEDVDTTIDGGELRLGGVTVNLLDEFGGVAASTVTAADGTYVFPSVPEANYTVAVDETTIPTGMASTTGNNPEAIVVAGAPVADVDFGYAFPGTIAIAKSPATQQVVIGGTATFSITVTNTGTQDLASVVVSDPASPDCNNTIGSLAAGTSTTYACLLTGATADFVNVAAVSGLDELGNTVADSDTADVDVIDPSIDTQKTPDLQSVLSGADVTFSIRVENTGDVALTDVTVADALTPACDATFASLTAGAAQTYDCTVTNVTADFTNIASVTGDDPLGNPVVNDDTADVDVIDPSIDIQKTPDLQTVLAGDDVTFTIRVENTGDVDLTNVTVTDALAPACDATFASVAVGSVQTYDCTVTNVTADFINTASVAGDHAAGGTVTDHDTAAVDVVGPAIAIAKGPNPQQVVAGGTVTFDITVTNTGDVALSDVAVTDGAAPLCNNTIGALAIGETVTYSCDLANVAADFTNIASVVGTHPASSTVSDDDSADVDVINPAVEVLKTPDSQQATAGSTVSFDITVTNTGDVDLTDVSVTDTPAPSCDATFASLAAGAVETYSCTMTAGAVDFTNTALVTGDDPLGDPVTDSDTADVDVIDPTVDIQKTPDLQTVLGGDDVTFTIRVENTGDVVLTDVTVTDTLAPDCDATSASLAASAVETYSCTLTAVTGDFTNTVSVVGDHPAGGTVSDSDTADVDVVGPAISIEKNPDTQQVLSGGTATFDITVTNTGDVDLVNVVVSDPLAPACDNPIGALAVGASTTYSCDLSGIAGDLTNTASVT